MHPIKRFFAYLACAAWLVPALAGPSPAAEQSVLLYTSAPKSLLGPLREGFGKSNPGWRLRVFRARASTVLRRLENEWRAGRPRAAVLWAGDASLFIAYKKAGRLAPYSPPGAAAVPADLKDPGGAFHAVRLFHLVIAYKPGAVAAAPKGFADLLRLTGRKEARGELPLALPSPERSGASLAGFFAWSKSPALGWTFIRRLISLRPILTGSFGEAADAMKKGKARAAVLADFIVYRRQKLGERLHIVWPAEGAVAISGPAGIMKKREENPGARRLIRFLLSKPAQETIQESGLYAARADVPPPAGRPPLAQIKRAAVDWGALPAGEKEILTRMRAMVSMAREKAKKEAKKKKKKARKK